VTLRNVLDTISSVTRVSFHKRQQEDKVQEEQEVFMEGFRVEVEHSNSQATEETLVLAMHSTYSKRK
jgi:hypothetical protein